MSERNKIADAHQHIDGSAVVMMILEFSREFRDVYPNHVRASSLCAVGPLQSLIGLAIKNGRLRLPSPVEE